MYFYFTCKQTQSLFTLFVNQAIKPIRQRMRVNRHSWSFTSHYQNRRAKTAFWQCKAVGRDKPLRKCAEKILFLIRGKLFLSTRNLLNEVNKINI
jgi:hypothetical protein